MDFRIMITDARRKQNLTQREMAEKLNVSDKTISKWETGVNFPDLKMLNQISKVLGISVTDLLTAEDLKQPEQNMNEDNIVIGQFKTAQIVALILLGLSAVCIRFFFIGLLMFLAGVVLFGSSLIFFIVSLLSFQSRYEHLRETRKFDQLSNFYSLLYFDSIVLILLFYFFSIVGFVSIWFVYIPLIFLQVCPFLISKWILKRNHFSVKMDNLNRKMIASYWYILIVGNIFYCILLTGWIKFDWNTTGYVLLDILINIIWFSPLILGLTIPMRRKYVLGD